MQFNEGNSIELVNCLAIAEIGNNSIATSNFSEFIYIWDLENNSLIKKFSAHKQGIL